MEKLDKQKYLKRVIIVCWIALGICFAIKLFGGNLFEIMCENENFIKVCEYADNNAWAYYLINGINSFVLSYFYVLAMCQKIKYTKAEFIILLFSVVLSICIKANSQVLGFVFDIWQAVIMPCVFTIKTPRKHWNVIIGNILVVIFQLVSMFVKNIGIKVLTGESVLTTIIFSIDVFLMVILYYLYANVKGKNKNGN